ncbi:MAG: ComEC/Rec2 family competence protein [Alistipes sp.]|nr:ComEC/Rec2 family competence protein [Alistipes sp.]
MPSFSLRNIADKASLMPMAAIVLALIGGILLSVHYDVAWSVWLALVALSALLSLRWRQVVLAAVFAFGGFVLALNRYEMLPQSVPVRLVVEIDDEGTDYGRYSTYSANVLMIDGRHSRAKVRITADSLLVPRYGDIVELNATIRPFQPQGSGYATSMYRRGYSGRVTMSSYRIVSYTPNDHLRLHSRAVDRLKSLTPQSLGRDVAMSVTLGTRSITGSELSDDYSHSGASHLLAVSGLHVGLVFALLNILLLPLLMLWRGNIYRAVIVVAMIWLYVALCGYPTSAIRAAIMFTVLQLSYISKSRHLPENSLCTTAFMMLAIEPYMLFELSFSLSFTAVAAIVFVARPLITMIRYHGPLKGVVDGVVISTVCVVATAPLISHSFGVVSLLSIIITPLALITAQVIIVCNIAALILPLPVAQIVAQSAAWCGKVQNMLVHSFTEPGVGYTLLQIDSATMTACYAVMIALTLLSFGFRWNARKEE